MPRRFQALAFAAFLVTLVAGSSQRVVGDGAEYFAMAWSLASAGRPSLTAEEAGQVQRALLDAAPDAGDRDVLSLARVGADLRHDFVHFWLYPALVAPLVPMCELLRVSPTWAFVLVNLALLIAALAAAARRLHPALTTLLFAGPVIWWVDKVHTEVFTFSTLTLAWLLLRASPGWSMVAFGAASAQNPPLAVFLPLAIGVVWASARAELRSMRFWSGAVAGLGLALLHPAYSLWRFGTPSLLVETTRRTWPSIGELGAVLWDANIGLASNYPVFALVVAGAVVALAARGWRELMAPDVLAALAGGAALLVAFAQTGNFSHGGTPGMSRYALWLVPLALPILQRAGMGPTARAPAALWPAAVASALACVFAFHPRQAEHAHRPTPFAMALWTWAPAATNPLPEVFAESFGPGERRTVPVATAGCEKALLVGRGDAQGMWPAPCFPAEVPEPCRQPARLCYANLGREHQFALVGTNAIEAGFRFEPADVWGRAAEAAVRTAMNGVNWRVLRPTAVSAAGSMVRAVHGVERVRLLEAEGRAVVAILGAGEEARMALRPQGPSVAEFVDGRTGERLGTAAWPGPRGERWELTIPASRELLLLTLRPSR